MTLHQDQLVAGTSSAPNEGHLRSAALKVERPRQQQQGQVHAGAADGAPRQNRIPGTNIIKLFPA
jgi:hypothetical protein